MQARLRYVPVQPTGKQRAFCMLNNKEAFFGGGTRGGKTVSLLMAALQFTDVPGYNAVLFRDTYKNLMAAGALIDLSRQWLAGVAEWSQQLMRWTFPSGATLSFGYLDSPNDEHNYDGTEYQFIGFDEVAAIREQHYTYLFSRLVRPKTADSKAEDGLALPQVPLRARSTSNPGGRYHDWVNMRFVKTETRKPHIVYMPALLSDNPHVDAETYLESLAELDPIRRKQLLEADWEIQPEGAMFSREKTNIVNERFGTEARRIRTWDLAGTAETERSPDPDWTVGALLALDGQNFWRIEDIQRFRCDPGEVEARVKQTAQADGVEVPILIEALASWKMLYDHYVRNVLQGFRVNRWVPQGPKEVRASTFAAAWNNGIYSIVAGPNTMDAIAELCAFPGSEHDDVVDAIANGHTFLSGSGPVTFDVADVEL